MPAVHRGGDAEQVVPAVGDQLGVQPPGQQRPGQRVAGGEQCGGPGAVESDLAQVADPGRELLADQVEQGEVRQGGAVGVGGVLDVGQVGVVAGDSRPRRGCSESGCPVTNKSARHCVLTWVGLIGWQAINVSVVSEVGP